MIMLWKINDDLRMSYLLSNGDKKTLESLKY